MCGLKTWLYNENSARGKQKLFLFFSFLVLQIDAVHETKVFYRLPSTIRLVVCASWVVALLLC